MTCSACAEGWASPACPVCGSCRANSVTTRRTEPLPKTSSGASWTPDEHEQLRQAWVALCAAFPGRSEAALRSKLVALADRNYGAWPGGFRQR